MAKKKSRGTPRSSFRLSDETLEQIEQIAEHQGGLLKVQVIRNAVKLYHESIFGKGGEPKKKSKKSDSVS